MNIRVRCGFTKAETKQQQKYRLQFYYPKNSNVSHWTTGSKGQVQEEKLKPPVTDRGSSTLAAGTLFQDTELEDLKLIHRPERHSC